MRALFQGLLLCLVAHFSASPVPFCVCPSLPYAVYKLGSTQAQTQYSSTNCEQNEAALWYREWMGKACVVLEIGHTDAMWTGSDDVITAEQGLETGNGQPQSRMENIWALLIAHQKRDGGVFWGTLDVHV